MFTRINLKKGRKNLKAYRFHAPIKGVCGQRDARSGRELYALHLENWVFEKDGLKLRPGFKTNPSARE